MMMVAFIKYYQGLESIYNGFTLKNHGLLITWDLSAVSLGLSGFTQVYVHLNVVYINQNVLKRKKQNGEITFT